MRVYRSQDASEGDTGTERAAHFISSSKHMPLLLVQGASSA